VNSGPTSELGDTTLFKTLVIILSSGRKWVGGGKLKVDSMKNESVVTTKCPEIVTIASQVQ